MGGTIVLNHRIYALVNAYASVDSSRELDSNDDEPAEKTTTESMHPLGATWNQIGINRRSKQLANADKERITKGQWTHLHRALSSSQA